MAIFNFTVNTSLSQSVEGQLASQYTNFVSNYVKTTGADWIAYRWYQSSQKTPADLDKAIQISQALQAGSFSLSDLFLAAQSKTAKFVDISGVPHPMLNVAGVSIDISSFFGGGTKVENWTTGTGKTLQYHGREYLNAVTDTAPNGYNGDWDNRPPVISVAQGDSDGSVLAETDSGLTTSATLTVTDPDAGDPVSASATAVSFTGPAGALGNDDFLHMFSANASSGKINWAFDSGMEAFDYLGAGDSLTLTYTITANDGHGGTDTQTVTVRINGTNDAADLSSADVSQDETDAPLTFTGQLTNSDVDNDDTFQAATISDADGDFTIGTDGKWSFTASSALDSLNVGQQFTRTYTVKAADDTETTVKVTVNGTNDAPVITGGDSQSFSIPENTTAVATLVSNDVDAGAATWSILAGGEGSLFNISAGGVLSFKNAPDFEAPTDSAPTNSYQLTVQVSDGLGGVDTQAITVNVTNVSEGPTVAAPYSGGNDPNDFDTAGPASGSISTTTGNDPAVVGTSGADTISAKQGDDVVYGRGGDDNIDGDGGKDKLYGQVGNDTIHGNNEDDTIYGGSGDDKIEGGNHADVIYGGSGSDTIDGQNDADTIIGGYGADFLTGGGGADLFRFLSALDTGDTITDFAVGAAGDKLDFSQLGLTSGLHANTNTVFALGVSYFQSGADTIVWADTDGDVSTVELQVTLTGVTAANLIAGNFVL